MIPYIDDNGLIIVSGWTKESIADHVNDMIDVYELNEEYVDASMMSDMLAIHFATTEYEIKNEIFDESLYDEELTKLLKFVLEKINKTR